MRVQPINPPPPLAGVIIVVTYLRPSQLVDPTDETTATVRTPALRAPAVVLTVLIWAAAIGGFMVINGNAGPIYLATLMAVSLIPLKFSFRQRRG